MKFEKEFKILWKLRYGNTTTAINLVGNKAFKYFLDKGYIIQGKNYPEVWKISELGDNKGIAIFSLPTRVIISIIKKYYKFKDFIKKHVNKS